MTKIYRQGAIGSLLDEYEKAILDLSQIISDINDKELTTIVDTVTQDSGCESVQSILAHIVCSGYAYALYIKQLSGDQSDFLDDVFRTTISDYQKDLADFFIFTEDTFKNITDNQLEESDNTKKIVTSWGQVYDIEQIIEHAIVHVLRHRRQIEKFKIILREK
ncbi:DinB family protein [[Flexibacter] sp. ATCC 35103]|uniref:DinB family protein n=1 Tax=[Flexibacter] sp. ATCC 35103 TaxID=1937528 RepID=UPI0009CF20FD|nr:DinB family protein [[Flexibacter] sp. ATCC 35103]OMQ08685.1 damage-inducible protein DinB [[Flexibacter] sp. ATCC 35103]